jgi:hypothetical protein
MAKPFRKQNGGIDKDKQPWKPRRFLEYPLAFNPAHFLHPQTLSQ